MVTNQFHYGRQKSEVTLPFCFFLDSARAYLAAVDSEKVLTQLAEKDQIAFVTVGASF